MTVNRAAGETGLLVEQVAEDREVRKEINLIPEEMPQ